MFCAWQEFFVGKKNKEDVIYFEQNLEESLFDLHDGFTNNFYKHGGYKSFFVNDPKKRHIHKASVRDRVLHHAIHRVLNPYFEKKFIFDSYSSRKGKGVYKAIKRFKDFSWRISQNNTRDVWCLKLDIKKYFESINHNELILIISKEFFYDEKLMALIKEIIYSYNREKGNGIPLGNLTSQLFSNIYLDVFDQYIKRELRVKFYIRYADDFCILHHDKKYLENLLITISEFLDKRLFLNIHPDKIILRKYSKGIDFLGYILYPNKTVIRANTQKRMINRGIRYLYDEEKFKLQTNALFSKIKHERL